MVSTRQRYAVTHVTQFWETFYKGEKGQGGGRVLTFCSHVRARGKVRNSVTLTCRGVDIWFYNKGLRRIAGCYASVTQGVTEQMFSNGRKTGEIKRLRDCCVNGLTDAYTRRKSASGGQQTQECDRTGNASRYIAKQAERPSQKEDETMQTNLERYAKEGEQKTARGLIARALRKGYSVSVNDGEEWTLEQSTDRAAILAALATTDLDRLLFRQDGERIGSALLVWGNAADGSELIADHTDNPAMADLCLTGDA